MSVSGVSGSNFFTQASPAWQSRVQQSQKEFQQLGQDLQMSNLTAAQSDIASLQAARSGSPALPQTTNPLSQAIDQLAQDLQSGNLNAAQKDFATVQQDLQSGSKSHHHHHFRSATTNNSLAQDFAQLGQALSGGNLSAAQQAYSVLGQDLPLSQDSNALIGSTPSANSGLSITA